MDGSGGNPAGGSGSGFDPCECINFFQMNHENAMTRLTNMLRNAQTVCTDTECFTGALPGQPNTGGTAHTTLTNMYLILALWLALAFLLFIFRPRALRNNNQDRIGKSNNQNLRRDDDQDPPGPEVH